MKIDIITMGCSKNLVDSQGLARLFQKRGIEVFMDPETLHSDVAVVNTCGFIGDAKEESINMILQLCDMKKDGDIKALYVMGCLSQRYREELEKEIPQVDRFYGKFDWRDLADELSVGKGPLKQTEAEPYVFEGPTYIKISEGCNRKCAYCAIPIITGRHISRTMEDILDEVRSLAQTGVKEFQIIAQELTFYGIDIYKKQMIAPLIEEMAKIPGVEWIRLHYAYPHLFPKDLLRVIRENSNVCKYLDIALQHISDNVLTRMHRNVTKAETLDLIKTIRAEVPDIHLRTTLMVGFPGETDADFQELLDFVREMRFERMGAFAYSEEEGTFAEQNYEDDIPEEVKQERLDRLMSLQEGISAEINEKKIGQTLKVVIDRLEGDYYIGRTEYDSPEVDGEVLISADENLEKGKFYKALITDSDEFDLYATTKN
ncbi:MAG: 30S ribosomal protein S12 methylthiotransferase RimO [Alloprevotella sp.]|nr:30S ribosomal protein S12 methylthiotransferase RimO [Alloprevotella sp.]